MKAIHIINPGTNSHLEINNAPTPEPGANEILVKIKATALNRADLLQRSGNYPPPEGASDILGLEMAGIVDKVGKNVTKWQSGNRVFALLAGGGYAEYCVIHQDMAMPVPENLSFTEAAAIPETFLTAFQALDWLGELKEDEAVLIHAAGSGVGTSAIQLAHHMIGSQIVATAGKEHKLKTARELGAIYAYNYKEQDFSKEIQKDMGSDSIHLIIDFIGAPYWKQNIDVLATDGRVVYLSFLGGHKLENMSLAPILRKRLKIMGSTLRSRSLDYKIALTQDFADKTLHLFENDTLKPVIDSEYNWTEAEQAHRRMADNKNTGKIVLKGM
ncbi:MAG TPA: NAD(P)H-quinone oxidoreductase [Balneolaceae bacterium]|nr:NAD(P)H-quinone oxidoreductase [Balneolaceae bacterium]